jgi:hypothetical protein
MSAPVLTNDTEFFGFQATWLGHASSVLTTKTMDDLILANVTDHARQETLVHLFKQFTLPQAITADSFLERSENYADAWVVFYDRTSKNGIWIALGELGGSTDGIWSLTGGEYSWHKIQEVDIAASVDDDRHLKLFSLK